jgi:hypothetical protein
LQSPLLAVAADEVYGLNGGNGRDDVTQYSIMAS